MKSTVRLLSAVSGVVIVLVTSHSTLNAQGIVYFDNAESGTPIRWDPWIDPRKLTVRLDLLLTSDVFGPSVRLAETPIIPDGPRQGYLSYSTKVIVPGRAPGEHALFLVSITGHGGIDDPTFDLTAAILAGPGVPLITEDGFKTGRLDGWDTTIVSTIPEPKPHALLITGLIGWCARLRWRRRGKRRP